MSCNTGKTDRIIRVVVGLVLVAWALAGGNVLGYIGIVLIATAAIGFCPLYKLLGIDTGCKTGDKQP